MPFAGFGDFEECQRTMQEDGHDEDSAQSICGALQAEAKSDHGNVDELREALQRGAGLVADVGVDLVSGVDVPAVNSKWTMLKSGDTDGHDWRANSPILLSKADDEDGERRISYAAAMIPREPDKEGDVVPTPTVEKAAHDFIAQNGGVDTDHSLIDGDGEVVESWVLKEDRTFDLPDGGTETYGAGTWMVGIKWEAEPWQRIKNGELTGLSIYGMADHVELGKSATAKGFEVPFADEVVVHVVYESETAAEKASEQMGLGGAIHEHTLDGMDVFMPGETHDDFVEAYNDEASDDTAEASAKAEDPCWDGYTMVGTDANGDPRCVPSDDVPDADFSESVTPAESKRLALSKTEPTDGDSGKRDDSATEGMGDDPPNDDGGGDGPTIDELAASVETLTESVESVKDAVETEKQDAQEAAAMLADEMDMSSDVVMDILEAAAGSDPETVLDALSNMDASADTEEVANEDGGYDDEEDDEMDKSTDADTDPDHDAANVEKGGDGRTTAQKGITDDGASDGSGLSYAAAADDYGGDA